MATSTEVKQILTTLKLQMIWMFSCNTNVRVVELAVVRLAVNSVDIRSV